MNEASKTKTLAELALDLRKRYAASRNQNWRETSDPVSLEMAGPCLEKMSAAQDECACALFHASGLAELGCALIALGGSGRREVFEFSDADFSVIAPQGLSDEALAACAGPLQAAFWDAGIECSLSARTVEQHLDLARRDSTAASALADRRLACGNPELFAELDQAFPLAVPAAAFIEMRMVEDRGRHAQSSQSCFGLEPNVKTAQGAMRDLQSIRWMAKAAGLGEDWDDLAQNEILSWDEAETARICYGRFCLLRANMHKIAGRKADKLDFDMQIRLAESIGLGCAQNAKPASMLMQGYYAFAKSAWLIWQIASSAIQERTRKKNPALVCVGPSFAMEGSLVDAVDESHFARRPYDLLRPFCILQTQQGASGLAHRLTRALWRASRRTDPWLRSDLRLRSDLMSILRSPGDCSLALELMSSTGVLAALIPEFGRCEILLQHDMNHAYTVGRHTLELLAELDKLRKPEYSHEFPLPSKVAFGFDKFWILRIAGLFHDIAKGRGGQHEIKGQEDARVFCQEHGVEPEDAELACWLVASHLAMSKASQTKDLCDPDTIESFCAFCSTRERLEALFLLTFCDMRATGPGVYNRWKGQMLETLYLACWEHFGKENPRKKTGAIAERKADARKIMAARACAPGAEKTLWSMLAPSYFIRHSADQIAWHAIASAGLFAPGKLPAAKARVNSGAVELMVIAPDRPGLFADLAGWLSSNGWGVRSALLESAGGKLALDTFVIEDLRSRADPRDSCQIVEAQLAQALRDNACERLQKPAAARYNSKAKALGFAPKTELSSDSAGNWVLRFQALDRPGLLSAVAALLAERSVETLSAKISTTEERADDVFTLKGQTLDDPQQRMAIELALLDLLR